MDDDKRLFEHRPDGEFATRAMKTIGLSFAILPRLVNLEMHIMNKSIPLFGPTVFALILTANRSIRCRSSEKPEYLCDASAPAIGVDRRF
jgi:hypothetical protein